MQDDGVWHKAWPMFPRRTIDGQWTSLFKEGQVWRRKVHGAWQYKQDEEEPDDWLDNQW